MRLATITVPVPSSQSEKRDGRLVVVSADGDYIARLPKDRYPNLQSALDDWPKALPFLLEVANKLDSGCWKDTAKVSDLHFRAPLPRAYAFLDGSAFIQHVILARKARGAEPPEDLLTVPLMYQGMSDHFLGPDENISLSDESWGLDFEGEVAVIVDDVPMGVSPELALTHIKLLVLLNDISLRNLIPKEMKTGFGFLQSKPASALGPFAVTPDELGSDWKNGRAHLEINCRLNGRVLGTPQAGEMHFSFGDLIAHAAKTRALAAGTIIGSGTISNQDAGKGVACLVERRMREQLETGKAQTPYLKSGDVIELEMVQEARSVFGKIAQRVV